MSKYSLCEFLAQKLRKNKLLRRIDFYAKEKEKREVARSLKVSKPQ